MAVRKEMMEQVSCSHQNLLEQSPKQTFYPGYTEGKRHFFFPI